MHGHDCRVPELLDQVFISKNHSYANCGVHGEIFTTEELEKAMEELKAKRDDVHQKMEIAEQRSGLQRTEEVRLWLQNVMKIEQKFQDLSLLNLEGLFFVDYALRA